MTSRSQPADALRQTARTMAGALAHRGPDDAGEWVDAQAGLALGFRRLAVIDLSAAGHQPMVSPSGRYVATLNGEIYNYKEIRQRLTSEAAVSFRGHSDTEVMLAAFDAWGIAASLPHFNGMWALAVWDRQDGKLVLVRDRMGVKPLHYGFAGRTFLFASELKALVRHPDFNASIDRAALRLMLRFTYIPAPKTIYTGIAKLLPGTMLTFDPQTATVHTTTYWSVRAAARHGAANRFRGSEEAAAGEAERLLRDAVAIRMIADVPIGVFLSGGIDSSTVAALMQAQSSTPVRSFSIGVEDARYDEAPHARAIAAHLGTNHADLYVSARDAIDVIQTLPAMYDEPFADSSQIPTHLVARLARRHVTVSLSGDGGDELFGGYRRYRVGRQFDRLAVFPVWMRHGAGRLLLRIPSRTWDGMAKNAGAGDRVQKAARALAASSPDAMYDELVSHWRGLVIDDPPSRALSDDPEPLLEIADAVERMMFFDQISYLPDDILVKVDRASMAASLESREPLLDYRLVEFAWTLPPSMKVGRGMTKPVLRRVLRRFVPDALVDRPKMGFALPLEDWLRGPLRDWAESLLDETLLRQQGLLDAAAVRHKWREHLSGKRDWKFHLWAVLMLQAWQEAQ